MEKVKVRHIVGWRERETQVRQTRSRMRASSSAFKAAAALRLAAELKKKR